MWACPGEWVFKFELMGSDLDLLRCLWYTQVDMTRMHLEMV